MILKQQHGNRKSVKRRIQG